MHTPSVSAQPRMYGLPGDLGGHGSAHRSQRRNPLISEQSCGPASSRPLSVTPLSPASAPESPAVESTRALSAMDESPASATAASASSPPSRCAPWLEAHAEHAKSKSSDVRELIGCQTRLRSAVWMQPPGALGYTCCTPVIPLSANAVEIVNRDMPSDYFRLSREQGGTQGGCIVQLTRTRILEVCQGTTWALSRVLSSRGR